MCPPPATPSAPIPRGRRSLFRPCIDLHDGVVKQIVGGSLRDADPARPAAPGLQTNHTSPLPPAHFAKLYAQHGLTGGHVVKLGPRNDAAAREALAAWPGQLQVGGGITLDNALDWLGVGAEGEVGDVQALAGAGASKVIVTSWLFPAARFSPERLLALEKVVERERLVVDLSCRRVAREAGSRPAWVVAMNRWQDLTDLAITPARLSELAEHCSEFLIHAADVEGLCGGIDTELVLLLGEWMQGYAATRPGFRVTYAGGARHLGDMQLVDRLSRGTVDLTFGSALDLFGGSGVALAELVEWNKGGPVQQQQQRDHHRHVDA